MDEKALFTKFWTDESRTTFNVLSRIPEGSDYRPDAKSRTAKEIAWQIVCEEKMIIEALENGKAEWAPPEMPATMKGVLDAYESQSGNARPLEGPARGTMGWHARVLRRRAPRVADGVELPLRHSPSPGTDHHVPSADGIEGPADIRAQRRRAVAALRAA